MSDIVRQQRELSSDKLFFRLTDLSDKNGSSRLTILAPIHDVFINNPWFLRMIVHLLLLVLVKNHYDEKIVKINLIIMHKDANRKCFVNQEMS